MKKLLIITTVFLLFCPVSLKAVDPVTIAILAPVALKAAQVASPYVIRGMQCAGTQMVHVGVDLLNIFRLPLGIIQATLGTPFGMLGDGIANIGIGALSPFKLIWDTILIPVAMFGVTPG